MGLASCSKYLDINKSPLTATEVEPKLLFGYAITAWDANKNSGDSWLPISLFTQNIASGGDYGWGKENVYSLGPYMLGNTWKVYYSTAGNNLKQAIAIAETSEPVNNNAAAQCKIVLAQLMYEATTLYGDVPFSEAWDAVNFPYPKYDPQKDVFEGVLGLLDEAKGQIDPNNDLKISDYDVYYHGDMDAWTALANSIKLKVLMTMVDKDPTKAEDIGELVSNPSTLISSAEEAWVHPYFDKTDNENPKYRLLKEYTNGENQWFFANTNVFKFMEPHNDPRIPQFFDKGPKATGYKAVESEVLADETTSLISAYLYRKDAPSPILTYQETLFFEAEAYARGLGVAKNLSTAQDLFKRGVEAAMNFYEADPSGIQTYLANELPDLATSADPVKEIHIQQWIDLMDRPTEAFTQWRRSGPEGSEIPELKRPSGATSGPLIRRLTLSPDEISANPSIPSPLPRYTDKVWFDE
ncbi:SusD/RagB family nutrient-binding outer membrane lipoprotein [Olivibacter ginsenosidimutans]